MGLFLLSILGVENVDFVPLHFTPKWILLFLRVEAHTEIAQMKERGKKIEELNILCKFLHYHLA